MSDEQKEGGVAGAAGMEAHKAAMSQTAELAGIDISAEMEKPKRRTTAKAQIVEEAEEGVKPKRARASSRSSKTKNVLTEALPTQDVQPGKVRGQGNLAQTETDNLPPLPPAPVPTPEGIAFMQQHVAFQAALERRTELRRAQLDRSGQALQTSPSLVAQTQGRPDVQSGEVGPQTKTAVQGADSSSNAGAAKASIAKAGKAAKENVIEAGRDIGKGPISEVDPQDLQDAEDARLLRQLLERSRALSAPRNATAVAKPAAAIAQSDVGTLRMIKDAAARKLGLAVVGRNRHEDPNYKVEFDRLAPELKMDAQEVNGEKPAAVQTQAAVPDKVDRDTARLTTVPDSVRKRFLKVDSDYYFPDRSPAFVDRGARLATRGEHPEVIVALVEIARERGWNSVTVKGSESFRRAAWMEATRNGLQVAGYKPTELDLAQLNQREPANLIEPGAVREQGLARPRSLAKPVDQTLNEKLSAFVNDKPTLAVKKYPDLVQAYALLDAARKFAEAHLPGHEAKFIAIGKELITQQLREGKEVIGPKIHPDQVSQSRSGRDRSGSSMEKISQPEVQVRER
ncbi:hypothetical protein NX784_27935 [Massilia pinisoli]|uniref:Large polyvalent protein-associated domain-containing protein n=1 Tax=Massilia pinisoli TaxID=1772194 RepID=A0ABT1ZZQ0_9BURK|nr:LPD7 domain-containing protein [Massilia pinisoli]MCS0585417.1 hypothetical protein [Massilia pinisoli]